MRGAESIETRELRNVSSEREKHEFCTGPLQTQAMVTFVTNSNLNSGTPQGISPWIKFYDL